MIHFPFPHPKVSLQLTAIVQGRKGVRKCGNRTLVLCIVVTRYLRVYQGRSVKLFFGGTVCDCQCGGGGKNKKINLFV